MLQKRIKICKDKAVSVATLKSKKNQWNCYKDFCSQFNLSHWCMSLYQLSLYVVFLSEFMCYSSIVAYLHALRFMAYRLEFPVPEVSSPELKFILQGIKCMFRHKVKPSKPMRWSYFSHMYKTVRLSSPLGCQFWSACLLMFRSLLRIPHFIPSEHTLCWSDVRFKEWGVVLCVRSAKCRYSGIHLVPIAEIPNSKLCAVKWLKRLFAVRQGNVIFPLLNYSNFRSLLKFSVLKAHIGVRLTSHSFRRGGASFLSATGLSLPQIKRRGGWESNCVIKYIDEPFSVQVQRELQVSKSFF